jgi:hypothetical protein
MKTFKNLLLISIILLISLSAKSQLTYYAAPAAEGNGDGSSEANAAGYLDKSFWEKVQEGLSRKAITVWLCNGEYRSGTLNLALMGDPMHQLTVRAETDYKVDMIADSTMAYVLNLKGAENMLIRGLIFRGPCRSFGVACHAEGKRNAKNLRIEKCQFLDLEKAKFGGLLLSEASNIVVRGCTFKNVGIGGGSHMIYSNNNSRDLAIVGCSFTDCKGDYVRFRNGTGYVRVDSCSFISNEPVYSNEFILIPLFNDVNPGDEFFGTDFQFTNNSFTYKAEGRRRHAIQFRCDGYNVSNKDGLNYLVNENECKILNSGTVNEKEAILKNHMGLDNSTVKIYGNTYSNVDHQVVYWYHPNYGANNKDNGFCDTSDWPAKSGIVSKAPCIVNGDFEMRGNFLRKWGYTGSAPIIHPGLNGTSKAVLLDSDQPQELFQLLNNTKSNWVMDCLFAVGAPSGKGTFFRIDVGHNELKDSRVSIAFNNEGKVGILDDEKFIELPELGKIEFSSVSASGKDERLKWYHLRLNGNYSVNKPTVDVSISEGNSMILSKKARHLSNWVNGAPTVKEKPSMVNFFSNSGKVVVDEVDVK